MKKTQQRIRPAGWKRRMFAATSMLLISAIMLMTVSYAWLVLSTAPEVTGISTNIGANGSLEIALLDTRTRADLSLIESDVGDSMEVQGALAANVTWGNLVDLGDASYGLGEIVMQPSQLILDGNAGSGYSVRTSNPLALPLYGKDGRITELSQNTVSAIYSGGAFTVTERQSFGVRGIGLVDAESAESSAVSYAKSNISAFSGSAKNAAVTAVNNSGSALIGIVLLQQISSDATYGTRDLDTMKSIITGLQNSLNYIELALRYGILAKVALADQEAFSAARATILDQTQSITAVYEPYAAACPAEMGAWVAQLDSDRNILNNAYADCIALEGTEFTAAVLNPILNTLLDKQYAYIDDTALTNVDTNEMMGISSFTLSLLPGSGVLADIADFVGDYSTWITYAPYQIEFAVRTAQPTAHLAALSASIGGDEAPVSSGGTEITSLGGYALDLAFRCNAAEKSDLQLQIAPEQRVYTDSISGDLQGGGSYMQFSTKDKSFSTGRMVELMDAIRVTFIDTQGEILAMAKLNTSNREVQPDGSIRARVYLYDYAIGVDRTVTIGERRSGDVKITELEQNVAKAVTVVVWLDGKLVDNTKVSATADASLNGILNLQFSSSADLIPAGNNGLYHANANRGSLVDLLAESDDESSQTITSVYKAGQGSTYTDVSWNAFAAAYEYAALVIDDPKSSSGQLKAAYNNLNKTYDELQEVSHEALAAQIAEMRALMGTGGALVSYAYQGELINEFTQEIRDKSTEILSVDFNRNVHDEGNGIMTPTYTQASWNNLALALYTAEAVNAYDGATDAAINAAITNLEKAYTDLQHAVLYEAYELNGTIYYKAISNESDSYGKWYDADFRRIISDLTILDLDMKARPAVVAKIECRDAFELGDDLTTITPTVDLENNAYSAFKNDEIIGVSWGVRGLTLTDVNDDFRSGLSSLVNYANHLKNVAAENAITLSNLEELNAGIAAGQAYLNLAQKDVTDTVYAQAMQAQTDLSSAVSAAAAEMNAVFSERAAQEQAEAEAAVAEAEAARTTVNERERTILYAAINTAKALVNEEDPNVETLRTALAEAEAVYAKELEATREEYEDALEALNNAISAAGGTPRTAYNTIRYSLGYTVNDTLVGEYMPTNRVALPSAILRLDSLTPMDACSCIVSARILTRNGVVYTAEKTIKLYNKARGIGIYGDGQIVPYSKASEAESFTIDAEGKTVRVAVYPKKDSTEANYPWNETITTYRWSVSDMNAVKLEGADTAVCKVTTNTAGKTLTLTLAITTDTGSEYTDTITLHT